MPLVLMTACTTILKNDSEEKNDENGSTVTFPADEIYGEESDYDIDKFFEDIPDMFPGGINADSTGLTDIPGMDDIYGMLGMEITPVPFTPEKFFGANPEWPWAAVEIGWKGYGDESKWQRYSDLFDDEEEEYTAYETPPPTNDSEPLPPTAHDDQAYHAEPDINMPGISTDKWPAAYLPPGTPQYPEGVFEIEAYPGNVTITIYNSTVESLIKYLETLKNAGWRVDYGVPEVLIMGGKGMWWFQCACYDGSTVYFQFMYDEWGM